uniref:Uncharacterized protein n=1 Tax=Romanomermis culicivorax TaxID=13658 RepID=A0A915JW21_ROMCU
MIESQRKLASKPFKCGTCETSFSSSVNCSSASTNIILRRKKKNYALVLKIGVPKSKKENVSNLFCTKETKPARCIYSVIEAKNLRVDPKYKVSHGRHRMKYSSENLQSVTAVVGLKIFHPAPAVEVSRALRVRSMSGTSPTFCRPLC